MSELNMINDKIAEFTKKIRSKERNYSFMLWSTGLKYGVKLSTQDIEDIIGDGYLLAVTKMRSEPKMEISYPVAWFTRILLLTCLNALRKHFTKDVESINNSTIDELSDTDFIYDAIDSKLDSSILRSLIDTTLSDQEKKILQMSIEGYTNEEILDSFERSENKISYEALRQSKSRAIKKLKSKLL